MLAVVRRSYLLFLHKLPLLLLMLLPLLILEVADTAMDKDQMSKVGLVAALVVLFIKIEVMLVIYTYLLEDKFRFGYAPKFMFKFFLLDFLISLIAVGPTIIIFHLLDVTFVDVSFPNWVSNSCVILSLLYTLWILPRLSLLYPLFIKGESIKAKTWWKLTADKNWRWLVAGVFICGPDLFSRFWNYNSYVEIVWSNIVLLLPVCFSVIYYKNRMAEKS